MCWSEKDSAPPGKKLLLSRSAFPLLTQMHQQKGTMREGIHTLIPYAGGGEDKKTGISVPETFFWLNVIICNTAKLLPLCPTKSWGNGAGPSPLERREDCVLLTAQTPGPGEYGGSGESVLLLPLCSCPTAFACVKDWGDDPLSLMGNWDWGKFNISVRTAELQTLFTKKIPV